MKSIIERYLAFSHLVAFLVSVCFSILFLLTFQMLSAVRLAMNKDVSLVAVLEILGHMALTFIPIAIPLAMLFATLYTLDKLSSDSAEYLAMRSLGFGQGRLLAPFLSLAVLVGLATFALNNRIVPYSKREYRQALAIMASKGVISEIRGGNFFTEIPNTILFAEETRDSGKEMDNIFIHSRDRGEERTIFAKRGAISRESESKWGVGQLQLILEDGSILTTRQDSSETEKILFQRYHFPFGPNDFGTSFTNKSSMKSSLQLYDEIRSWEDRPRDMQMRRTEIELYSRFNTPLLCIVFTLIAFSLGIRGMRNHSRGSVPTAMTILGLYYSLFFGGISLAKQGMVAPSLTVFLPTLLGLGIGILLFRRPPRVV